MAAKEKQNPPEPEKSMAPEPRMESGLAADSQPWGDHSQ